VRAVFGLTTEDLITMFYFGIRIEYKYKYRMTQTKSLATVARQIFAKIRHRLNILSNLRWSVAAVLLQLILLIAYK
jgi:hypothetical protein